MYVIDIGDFLDHPPRHQATIPMSFSMLVILTTALPADGANLIVGSEKAVRYGYAQFAQTLAGCEYPAEPADHPVVYKPT